MEGREVGRAPMDPMCENKQRTTTLCPGVQHAIPSLPLSLLLSLSARLLTENRNGSVDAASGFDNLELHVVIVVVVQFLLISCSRASPAELEIFCSPLSSFASSLASCVALSAEHRTRARRRLGNKKLEYKGNLFVVSKFAAKTRAGGGGKEYQIDLELALALNISSRLLAVATIN